MANQKSNEFAPKKTSPNLNAGIPVEEDKLTRRYDLVEQMEFLYVRIVRASDLPGIGAPAACDPYVELKMGNLNGTTRFFRNTSFPVWNQVFAFEKEKIQDLSLEVRVKNRVTLPHSFVGQVKILLPDVPKRLPPESSLAPAWHKLEDESGTQVPNGDIMLSVWYGTQADEYFPQAWFSDSTMVSGDALAYTRSKVYMSPTLWYLRVNVIQAQDLLLRFSPENSEIFVQVDLGKIRLRTGFSKSKSANPIWNEDLMFVAQEPFDDAIILSVQQGNLGNHVSLGQCQVSLKNVDKRIDGAPTASNWYSLDRPEIIETAEEVMFYSKLNARISLDGAYHVMDEPIEFSSDFRASSKKLWKPSIGILELGILKATGLAPMKMEARTDAYCVAKYGPKWARTRTIVNSLSPKWNEQYMWEVYDPFTVITIAVIHNNQLDAEERARGAIDTIMGKVRIRLSALDQGKLYTHSYPVIGLNPSGVKKMGEVHLAVRFSYPLTSLLNVCLLYIEPILPRHHHIFPLSAFQLDTLRNQAAYITSQRLSRAEPPLGRELVYYILDVKSEMWSMRRGKANFNRIMSFVKVFVELWKWLEDIRYWKNPVTTILFYLQCILALAFPGPIPAMAVFSVFLAGVKNFFKRSRHPPHMDVELSCADVVSQEDLEEEFDVFPTEIGGEALRKRYDRLRVIAGTAQKMANDLITKLERLQSLRSWRDPRATAMFLIFCCSAFLVTLTLPPQLIIIVWITFCLRLPRFRNVLPSVPENFIRRMPSKRAFIL